MSEEVYRSAIEQIAATTRDANLHHFGESLLHPKLGPFIALASARSIRTYLSVNPGLLNETRIRTLIDNGLHELVLSMDGVTPETLTAVRGTAARDISRAEQMIFRLLEYKASARNKAPSIVLQFVAQRQNAHEASQWLQHWSQVPGIDNVRIKPFVTWTGDHAAINELAIQEKTAPAEVICDKPWTSVTVLWDGRVVPCCFDYDGIYPLGDLRTHSLREIWNSPESQALRASHKANDLEGIRLCRHCVDKEGDRIDSWKPYPISRMGNRRSTHGHLND
jgi:radical SAM protein with 4Fe4S-binding SPASM domain